MYNDPNTDHTITAPDAPDAEVTQPTITTDAPQESGVEPNTDPSNAAGQDADAETSTDSTDDVIGDTPAPYEVGQPLTDESEDPVAPADTATSKPTFVTLVEADLRALRDILTRWIPRSAERAFEHVKDAIEKGSLVVIHKGADTVDCTIHHDLGFNDEGRAAASTRHSEILTFVNHALQRMRDARRIGS